MSMIFFRPLKLLYWIKQMSFSCRTGNMFRYMYLAIASPLGCNHSTKISGKLNAMVGF